MTPPLSSRRLAKDSIPLSSDPGTLLGRRPVEKTGGRPVGPGQDSAYAEAAKPTPWSRQVGRFMVSLLFLPAEAVKEVLERRPGALRRP